MRETTRQLTRYYIDQLGLTGKVLEIGGHKLANCAVDLFPAPQFDYHDLNIAESDIPQTIIADITGCKDVVPDDSFDIVFTSDVFEHIDRPWLAAPEIARILKPGGIAIVWTLFAWRNHPCPIDYWRYSAECLEFLFGDLTVVEKGYDLGARRSNVAGRWKSGRDSVPVDDFGGWREQWAVYGVFTKGPAPALTPFKATDLPHAEHLRADTQGHVTNPEVLGTGRMPEPVHDLAAAREQIRVLTKELERATKIARLTNQLGRVPSRVVQRVRSLP